MSTVILPLLALFVLFWSNGWKLDRSDDNSVVQQKKVSSLTDNNNTLLRTGSDTKLSSRGTVHPPENINKTTTTDHATKDVVHQKENQTTVVSDVFAERNQSLVVNDDGGNDTTSSARNSSSPFLWTTGNSTAYPCRNRRRCWSAPAYRLRHCHIPKTSSTNMVNLFLRLTNVTTELLGHDGIRKIPSPPKEEMESSSSFLSWTTMAVYREPHERLLSAYLDTNDYQECEGMNFQTFVLQHLPSTSGPNQHFQAQTSLCDPRSLDHMIDYAHMAEGVKMMLQHVGAWDTYGARGWGENGTQSFLETPAHVERDFPGSTHELLGTFYTEKMWDKVTQAYLKDMEFFPDSIKRPNDTSTPGDFASVKNTLLRSKSVTDNCSEEFPSKIRCGCYERLSLLGMLSEKKSSDETSPASRRR